MRRRYVIGIGVVVVLAIWLTAGLVVLTNHLSKKVAAVSTTPTSVKSAEIFDMAKLQTASDSYVQDKQYDKAAAVWASAITKAPDANSKYDAAIQEAQVYVAAGDHAKAIAAYQLAQEAAGKVQFGDAYGLGQQEFAEALEQLETHNYNAATVEQYRRQSLAAYQQALPLAPSATLRQTISQQISALSKLVISK